MSRYNLWPMAVVCCLVGHLTNSATADDSIAPQLTGQDQRFLSRVARRTYEQFTSDGTRYKTVYAPPSLREQKGHVVVTLYQDRVRLGTGTSGPGPFVPTTIEATLAALRSHKATAGGNSKGVGDVLIEIEAIGPDSPVGVTGQWLQPGVIERFLETGVDGFTLKLGSREQRLCPSEIIAKNITMSDALKTMMQSIGGQSESLTLRQFKTRHWYQPGPGREIVSLRRGLTVLRQEQVTRAAVNRAIDAIIKLLRSRQRPSGYFEYEYEPAASVYSSRDDPVHQAGATWALAIAAANAEVKSLDEAADRAIGVHQSSITELPDVANAAFVTSEGQRNKLGLTAQVLLAMAARPGRQEFTADRERLINAIIWLQQPNGRFVTAFPPARRLGNFEVHPALALLAVLEQYRSQPDDRLLQVFNRAYQFYTDIGDQNSILAAAWIVRPFAQMASVSNRKEFTRLSYMLADRLIEQQLGPENCEYPELYGGVSMRFGYTADARTAVCLSAWLDVLQAARHFGDSARVETYLRAAENGARFVLQLQIRKEEVYYMQVDRDAVGGIRSSVTDNRIRLENLQYSLFALIKYRDVVFQNNK